MPMETDPKPNLSRKFGNRLRHKELPKYTAKKSMHTTATCRTWPECCSESLPGMFLSLPYLSFHTEFLRDQIDFAILAAMLSDHT